ncbi:MAG: hypothetical protein FWF36_03180 [Propionibacteriaceae bacterium]|nr:hypothetical protein [Propionibacteriaceae bacterium]
MTAAQVLATTQAFIAIADRKQQNPSWTPEPGLARTAGVSMMDAIRDVFAMAPQASVDGDGNASLRWQEVPANVYGKVWTKPDGLHLGVDGAVLGLVMQAIAPVMSAIDVILIAWSHHLLGFLTSSIPASEQARLAFFESPDNSAAALALARAAEVLDFIVDNAVEGLKVPADKAQRGFLWMGLAVMAASNEAIGVSDIDPRTMPVGLIDRLRTIRPYEVGKLPRDGRLALSATYPTFVQALAELGYFDAAILRQADERFHLGLGSASAFVRPGTPGGPLRFDMTAPGATDWLFKAGIERTIEGVVAERHRHPGYPSRVAHLPT